MYTTPADYSGRGLGELGIPWAPIASAGFQIFSYFSSRRARKRAERERIRQIRAAHRQNANEYVYQVWPQYVQQFLNVESARASEAMQAMQLATGPIAVRLGEKVREAAARVRAGAGTFPCCGAYGELSIPGPLPGPLNPYQWAGPAFQYVDGSTIAWARRHWENTVGRLLANLQWAVKMIPTFAVHVKAPVVSGRGAHTVYVQPPPSRGLGWIPAEASYW